jgi:hypothetical protein
MDVGLAIVTRMCTGVQNACCGRVMLLRTMVKVMNTKVGSKWQYYERSCSLWELT